MTPIEKRRPLPRQLAELKRIGLEQGQHESDADFAARCRAWCRQNVSNELFKQATQKAYEPGAEDDEPGTV